jgi:hypothetical protein
MMESLLPEEETGFAFVGNSIWSPSLLLVTVCAQVAVTCHAFWNRRRASIAYANQDLERPTK